MALPNRPSDPSTISFDPSCFEVTGTREEYAVGRSALHSGPAYFGTDRAAANAFAKRRGRDVLVNVVTVKRRIRWTLE